MRVRQAVVISTACATLGAALALGELQDASGAELITAFVAGYEIACRIARATGHWARRPCCGA